MVLNVPWAMAQNISGFEGHIALVVHSTALFADDVAVDVAVAAETCKIGSGKIGSQNWTQLEDVSAMVYDLVHIILDIGPDIACCRLHSQKNSSPEY